MEMLPVLPEIIVEEEIEVESSSSARKKRIEKKMLAPKTVKSAVAVPVGVGNKEIDPTHNELGIEQSNMEYLSDIAKERRNSEWFLDTKNISLKDTWRQQIQADISIDQKVKMRTFGTLQYTNMLLEGGIKSDHRPISYLKNEKNPYDARFNQFAEYRNKKEQYYAKLMLDDSPWTQLFDFDYLRQNVRAGATLTGEQIQHQESANAQWKNLFPFIERRESQFNSKYPEVESNITSDVRGGLEGKFSFFDSSLFLNPILAYEKLDRSYPENSLHPPKTQFSRTSWKGNTHFEKSFSPYVEVESHLKLELAHDTMESMPSGNTQFNWDTGASFSTSYQYPLGFTTKARRFSNLPTPTQQFGDGALLLGSPQLPPETGLRISFGPWWKEENLRLHLFFFHEKSANAPLFMAVSPYQARTFPVGGVWARGLEAKILLEQFWCQFSSSYQYQQALNDSQILWQRGKAVPGRPAQVFQLDFNTNNLLPYFLKLGSDYRYLGPDALDLNGLWFTPPTHQMGAFLAYTRTDWEIRLQGRHQFNNRATPIVNNFQGMSNPSLLTPLTPQTEIRVVWEMLF